MDFGGLPPEINSARIYAGPGSASMMAAASAWNGLAAELRSTASSYGSVISALTDDSWVGPSSAAMEASAAPYVAWLNTAAAGAEQTAAQAGAAASAYQTAFASVVPLEVIAANRIELAQLTATNIYGQNTPAISTVEAQYGEMWAQDATAMYSYAGNSATASRLTAFTTPPTTTNPAGTANQTAATAQAAGASSAGGVQSALSQLVSSVPTSLQNLASPAASTTPTSLSSTLTNFLNSLGSTSSTAATSSLPGLDPSTLIGDVENDVLLFGLFMGLDALQPLMGMPISSMLTQAMAPAAAAAAPAAAAAGGAAAAAMGGAAGGFAGGAGGFAGLGAAASVGALSVPPSWGVAATPTWLAGMPLATPLPGVGGGRWLADGHTVPTERRRPGSRHRRRCRCGRRGCFQVRAAPQGADALAGRRLLACRDGSRWRIPSTRGPPARSRVHTAHRVFAEKDDNGNGHNGNGHNGY